MKRASRGCQAQPGDPEEYSAPFRSRDKFLSGHFPPMMVFSGRRVVGRASSFSPHKSALRFKARDEAGPVSRSILRVPDVLRVTRYALRQRNKRGTGRHTVPQRVSIAERSGRARATKFRKFRKFAGLFAARYHTSFPNGRGRLAERSV